MRKAILVKEVEQEPRPANIALNTPQVWPEVKHKETPMERFKREVEEIERGEE